VEISGAFACIDQSAIGERGFVGQAEMRTLAELREQRCAAHRADFFIGAQQHFVADAFFARQRLKCLEGREHHADAALHVGDARPTQHIAFTPRRLWNACAAGNTVS
jgi:hypothetical protein